MKWVNGTLSVLCLFLFVILATQGQWKLALLNLTFSVFNAMCTWGGLNNDAR